MCDKVEWTLGFLPEVERAFGECSGQGVAVVTNGSVCEECICNDGWTGRADFINTEGLDCQINILAVQILWGIHAIFTFWKIFATRNHFRVKWDQHMEQRRAKKMHGARYPLHRNRALFSLLIFNAITAPSAFGMFLLRVFKPEDRVGLNWIATILFAVSKTSLYVCANMLQAPLLASILKGTKQNSSTKKLIRLSDSYAVYNMVLSSMMSFIPFVTLLSGDNESTVDRVQQMVFMFYIGGMMLIMFGILLQGFIIKRKIGHALDRSHALTRSDEVLEIRNRLMAFQNTVMIQASLQLAVYAAFMFIPFLWNKHDYFLPVSWMVMPFMYQKLAVSSVARNIDTSSTDNNSSFRDTPSKEPSMFNTTGVEDNTAIVSSVPASSIERFREKATSFHELAESQQDGDDEDDYV